MTIYKVPWLERRTNTSGYCLTLDGQERDGCYVKTLCDLCITLPTSIEVYEEVYDRDDEDLCRECVWS